MYWVYIWIEDHYHYCVFCKCFLHGGFHFFNSDPEVPIHFGVTVPIHFSSACGQINSKSLITHWIHRKQICRSLDQRMCLWPSKLKLTAYKSSLPAVCEEFHNDWCVEFNVKISLNFLSSRSLCLLPVLSFSLSTRQSSWYWIRQVWCFDIILFTPITLPQFLRPVSQYPLELSGLALRSLSVSINYNLAGAITEWYRIPTVHPLLSAWSP